MESIKIVGFVNKINGNGILLQTRDKTEWYNMLPKENADKYITQDLINQEVEITLMDIQKRTFSFITKTGLKANYYHKSVELPISKETFIIRQNSLSQANEFIRTLQVAGLLENCDINVIEEMYFNFASKCEQWVQR